MASFCSSNDKCNFQWVTVASVDLIKLPLRDILASHIKPADLFQKIQSCSTLKLLPDQQKFCLIQPPGLPDYNTFDFTLLYTLIRNLCCLPSPAQGWGKEPKAKDIEISDDIERLRLFRNNYYGHAISSSISDAIFEAVWRNLKLVIKRFNSKKRCSTDYEEELIMIERSKFTDDHLKTCRILLDAFASIQKQTNSKDEPDISIIGENEKKCGETALFEANVEMVKSSNWTITWYKHKGNVSECIDTSKEKYRDSTKRRLVIKSVCKEDEGKYQAVLSFELNGPDYRSKNTIPLYVLEDVLSVKIFVNSPVCFGSKTIIKSEVSSTTTPEKIEWQKSKDGIDFHCIIEPILFRTTARLESPFYVIPKTTFTDKLYYRLLVWNENGEGVSNNVYLDVTGNPPNIMTSFNTNIKDRSVKLIGNLYVYDDSPGILETFWTKNEKKINPEKSGGKLSEISNENPSLTIKNVSTDDAGEYRLTATNAVGSSTSDVIVLGYPIIFLEKFEDKKNGRHSITVMIESLPAPYHVQWSSKNKDDEHYTPIDINTEEYEGTTVSFPHPVLVLRQKDQLEKNCFEIEVTNFIGKTVHEISGENKPVVLRSTDNVKETPYNDHGASVRFTRLNNILADEFPLEKVEKLKFLLKTSKKVKNRRSVLEATSAMNCLTILQDENLFTQADVIFMQFLCRETGCLKLNEKCIEYAEKQKALCFFEKQSVNGCVDVQFHVQGDISGYTKEFIREVIETVAAILDCKEEDIHLNAVRYSTSFFLSLSIKKVYIRKLLALKEQDRLKLKNLNIDYLKIDEETIYLNIGEDNKMECRIRENSNADVDDIETEQALRDENNRKSKVEEIDSEEEHKNLLVKNDDDELFSEFELMDLMPFLSDYEDEPVNDQERESTEEEKKAEFITVISSDSDSGHSNSDDVNYSEKEGVERKKPSKKNLKKAEERGKNVKERQTTRNDTVEPEKKKKSEIKDKISYYFVSKTNSTMNDKESILKDLRRRVSALQTYSGNNELYSIVGPLIQKEMTTLKCRELISAYEEKHLFYFALFKPQIENPKESWIENAKRDIRSIRKNAVAPSLRECYAVSEVISRSVVLMYECEEEGFIGIQIEPVIREMDDENDHPLILFLRFDRENVHFIRCDENIDRYIYCGLKITNRKHSKCVDKRFRNNFETLRHFLLTKEKRFLSFSKSSYSDVSSVEITNMFDLFAQIIYGNPQNEKDVKDFLKAHIEADDFIQVYMQLVNVEENISENVQNKKNAETLRKQLSKDAFRKQLTDWKSANTVHLFALASIFNAAIYVVSRKDVSGREESNLYLPICGSYLYTFESPLVFKSSKESPSFEIDRKEECLCRQKTPEIIGQFPIANNTIDLDRIRSLKLMPCCPPVSRHGLHQHYKHIPEKNKSIYQRDDTPWPGELSDDYKHINDILAEEGRQLELLLGGKGTLAKCISKDVFGNEDVELPMSFPENDFERSLQIAADWTGFPIYIFQNSKENCSWEITTPTTYVKAKNCRYFITLFLQTENGREYVDRITSKTGCNCMLAPPYVARKVEVSENQEIGKIKRHRPLIKFFQVNPPENWFCDDVRREMNIIPIHSELRLVMERTDMGDRMIDTISDHTHSLYRCMSKDIFGSEEQYQTIMQEVIAEIKENPNIYGSLLIGEKESADFKYRDHKVLDAFRFRDTILKESATFFTERIEDGMALQDLELIAAATCFQVPIYVLSASIHEDRIETKWKLYIQIRRRKQPKDFLKRRQYFAHKDAVYKSLFDAENVSKFHITLFRTFSGQFHRIAARYRVCNCLMDPPVAFVPQKHKHDNQSDFRIFYDTNRAKSTLTTAKLALDMWIRCNMALEILCSEIIDELEGRRRNVNISTIVGSSVGIAGSAFAIAGVIAAPFTAGMSLGLTVGGAVIGFLSGVTVVGATVTEVVLNRDANAKFERYYMNFRERSRVLEDSLKKLQKLIQVIQERTMHTDDANGVDATTLQVAAGTLSMIRGIPIAVARVVLRAASFADIVLPPLTGVGFLVFSVYNLVKGSKTNVTEKLRSFRSVLRASRTQLSIMAYGNKIKYLQNPTYKK